MDWIDAEELAANVCGCGEDYDSNIVEEALFEKFEVSFEQFHKIAECLLKLTPPVKSELTDITYHAFIKDGVALAKERVEI